MTARADAAGRWRGIAWRRGAGATWAAGLIRLDRLGLVGAIALGLIFGVAIAAGWFVGPNDARIYWANAAIAPVYGLGWELGYVYPPPLAQALAFLAPVGWEVFIVGWTTLCFGCLWYVLRWATLPILAAGFLSFALPLPRPFSLFISGAIIGGVMFPMLAAMVAAMRHPRLVGLWAIPILTKVGPGIGVLWYVFRGEWRRAAIIAGVTLAVVAVSFALSPGAWFEYPAWVLRNYGQPHPTVPTWEVPLHFRAVAAVLVLAWGARTGRPWTVFVAAGLAIPALYAWTFLTLWAGAIGLAGRR